MHADALTPLGRLAVPLALLAAPLSALADPPPPATAPPVPSAAPPALSAQPPAGGPAAAPPSGPLAAAPPPLAPTAAPPMVVIAPELAAMPWLPEENQGELVANPSGGPPILMPPAYAAHPGHWPRTRPYADGAPPPPGYHADREPLRPLWVAGAATFAGVYGGTALLGPLFTLDDSAGPLLAIPFAGPLAFAAVEDAKHPAPSPGFAAAPYDSAAVYGGMVALTVGEVAGAAMFIAGFVVTKKVYRRNDVALVPSVSVGPAKVSLKLDF